MPARPTLPMLWSWTRASGLEDPVAALDLISYFVLAKWLTASGSHPAVAWSSIVGTSDDARARYLALGDAAVHVRAALARHGGAWDAALRDVRYELPHDRRTGDLVRLVDGIWGEDPAQYAAAYEQLLQHASFEHGGGRVPTPPALADAIVDTLAPRSGEIVLDPMAGSAELLVAAGLYAGATVRGYDLDAGLVRCGLTNLLLHGVEDVSLTRADVLRNDVLLGPADVVVSNPPFSDRLEDARSAHAWLGLDTARAELLFVELARKSLGVAGRGAVVVPHGLLFGTSDVHVELRRRLVEETRLVAVVSLPSGTFRPLADVQAAVILFADGEPAERVWLRELDGDDEIGALADAAPALTQQEQQQPPPGWWSAEAGELAAAQYNLLPSAYRPREHAAADGSAAELLDALIADERVLLGRLERLREQLHGG